MYQDFIGPVPVLHWCVSSDGEGLYDLTHYEMFIHVMIIYFFAPAVKRLTRRSSKDVILPQFSAVADVMRKLRMKNR